MPKKPTIQHQAQKVSRCLKGLTHEIRLQILMALRQGEMNVSALTEAVGCAQPTLSQHVGLMKERGILKARRQGTQIFYEIGDRRILTLLKLIQDVFCEKEDS